jgi:DNA-binding CsgD family transcriptional regulator
LIGEGHDSQTIARQLRVSSKTVDAHRGHLKEKLDLKTGTELICYAARLAEKQLSAKM